MVNEKLKQKLFSKLNESVTCEAKDDWDKYNKALIEFAEKLIKITQESPYFEDTWGMTISVETDLVEVFKIMNEFPGYEYDSKPKDVWNKINSL